MAAPRLHADDTPVPVLAPGMGKTKTGRLWVYVRDERPHGGSTPPAAAYFYSPDRKGEHPQRHLAGFSGHLVADAYAGFNALYVAERQPGPVIPVACWAPVRRQVDRKRVVLGKGGAGRVDHSGRRTIKKKKN